MDATLNAQIHYLAEFRNIFQILEFDSLLNTFFTLTAQTFNLNLYYQCGKWSLIYGRLRKRELPTVSYINFLTLLEFIHP